MSMIKNYRNTVLLIMLSALFCLLSACSDSSSGDKLVANAGEDLEVSLGDTATLDGSGSSAPEGVTLIYAWTVDSAPDGSSATLTNADTSSPSFAPDILGEFVIRLTVSDDTDRTAVATVNITAEDNKYYKMRYVKVGSFYMGSDDGISDVGPLHLVTLDAFHIDTNEVTVGEYRKCVEEKSCRPPYKNSSLTVEHYFDNTAYDDYPVVNVTYEDAKNYCDKWGKSLPTEAMWEKAARGETRYYYPWGNEPDDGKANYNNKKTDTLKVDSYYQGVSVYGIYNMSGNVSEWVADYYQKDFYTSAPATNPIGPYMGYFRVIRGGNFTSDIFAVQTVARDSFPPESASDFIGFRCVAVSGE